LHLDRWLHLVSSFWLPLPFLTMKGVDRGEDKSDLWFLMTLHTTENLLLVSVSTWAHLPDYPLSLLVIQVGFLTVNIVLITLTLAKEPKKTQGGGFVCFYLLLLAVFNVVAIILVFLSSLEFEIHLLAMDIGIISTNLLGLVLAVFYTKKMELFSELTPDNIPNLPSFGPEDVLVGYQHKGSAGEQGEETLAKEESETTV